MSKKINPTIIGAFVMGAVVLSVAGLILFGGSRFFDETFDCVLYFEESIDGLEAGAPVDFQGVRIGTVRDVRLIFDLAGGSHFYRPVTIRLEGSRIRFVGEIDDDVTVEDVLGHLVEESGLRARLGMQSILTGKLKIELGFFPGTPIKRQAPAGDLLEIPTVLSPLQRISQEMAQLPLHDIVSETYNMIKGMAEIVTSDEAKQLMSHLNDTMDRLQSILDRLDNEIEPLFRKSGVAIDAAGSSLEELSGILRKLDREVEPILQSLNAVAMQTSQMLDERSPLRHELSRMMEELTAAGRSVRWLADYLERHPESLLRGKSH